MKSTLSLGFVIVIALFLSAFFLLMPTEEENGDDYTVSADETPPGTNVTEELLDESTSVTYDEEDCLDIIQDITLLTDLVELEGYIDEYTPEEYNGSTSNHTDDTMFTELIQDNRLDMKVWRFAYPNELEIYVSADSGDIIRVSNVVYDDGDVDTIGEARDVADDIIEDLAPELDGIEALVEDEVSLSNICDVTDNGIVSTTIDGYLFYYMREESSINTTDQLIIEIDTSGNLAFFSKRWNLDMPGSYTPTVTESQALTTAGNYIDVTGYVTCDLWVVRPNYNWEWGERYGFSEGILVWAVIEYTDDSYSEVEATVWVDAQEGDTVGGF